MPDRIMLSVAGADGENDLRALRDLGTWLGAEPGLRGLVSLSLTGPVADAVAVEVDAQGALTALTASLKAWFAQPARAGLKIKVAPGREPVVAFDAEAARSPDLEKLLAQALGGTAAPRLRAESDEAWARGRSGDWSSAAAALSDIRTRQTGVLGAEHEDTLLTRQRLGLCVAASGDPEQAAGMLGELLPVQRAVLGPDHPDVLTTRQLLAVALGESGARDEAARQLRVLLPDRRRVLGAQHEDVLRTTHLLARNLIATAQYEEARALLREVASLRERNLGGDHPHTVRAQADLRLLAEAISGLKPE